MCRNRVPGIGPFHTTTLSHPPSQKGNAPLRMSLKIFNAVLLRIDVISEKAV